MFTLTVKALTIPMLKDKLIEAALALNDSDKASAPVAPGPGTWNPGMKEVPARIEPFPNQAPAPQGVPVSPPPAPAEPIPSSPNPIPTPIAPGPAGELDVKGMPWDERIHAATRAKTKDGSWRYRRGVEDDEINKVEAELRSQPATTPAAMPSLYDRAAAAKQEQQAAAPAPSLHLAPPPVPPTTVHVETPIFNQQPASVPTAPKEYNNIPVPEVQKSAHSLDTFKKNLINVLADLVRTGKLQQSYLDQLKSYFGVAELWTLNDQQLSELYENFCQIGLITRVA